MWTPDKIELKNKDGTISMTDVQRYGLWAVRLFKPDCYMIAHIPTGLALSVYFLTEARAKAAVEKITSMRNDWNIKGTDDVPMEMWKDVWKECMALGASNVPSGTVIHETTPLNDKLVKRLTD